MKRILLPFLILLGGFQLATAQVITFEPSASVTGFLPSNYPSGATSCVLQNTNTITAVVNTLTSWNNAATTIDKTLRYSSTPFPCLPT